MQTSKNDIIEFIEENDVKFIRLSFCDILGIQKNISIMKDEFNNAIEYGVPFDPSSINGHSYSEENDLFLMPDLTTLSVMPWRPERGRVIKFYSDIKRADMSEFKYDYRKILKSAVKKLADLGYSCNMGTECDFYLFHTDEEGEPTLKPYDKGGYLDIAPIDKGENIRREICLCLEEMGLQPDSSHHSHGPGQNKINFRYSNPLVCAENFLTFKSMVKAIASRNGLYASFMPKPLLNEIGNGLYINMALYQNNENLFKVNGKEHSEVAESFIAGILNRMKEITLFLNPIANSFERLQEEKTSTIIGYSHQRTSTTIRIPSLDTKKPRMELRLADPAINPYLVFSLLLFAGIEGIESKLELDQPCTLDKINESDFTMKKVPSTFKKAINHANKSSFVKDVLGEELVENYINLKQLELKKLEQADSKEQFFKDNYLGLY